MMKMVGRSYLTITLKSVVDEICESNKTCEIDPVKLKEGDNVEVNKENLQVYVQKVFSSITQSSASCPPLMCDVFRDLRRLASNRFPDDPHVQYSAVNSFVFLRFFAVAVSSPHTYQLRPHHPDPDVSRTLTLISKTIQTLGSWISLSKSKNSSFKESYMYDFIKLFQEDQCIDKVKKFLDEISSNVSKGACGVEDSVVLKEGEVHKRAQGKTRLGKKNFKKRWLRVTTRELSYHKSKENGSFSHTDPHPDNSAPLPHTLTEGSSIPVHCDWGSGGGLGSLGKDALCVIPVKNILGVEKLDENAFSRKNMFQVLLSERPLYVQAGNCVEVCEWIEVLSQVSRCNPGRPSTFHPSAYVTGTWLCCKETTENLPGCRPCTSTMVNIQLEIDCDRETERIYSLFSASLPRLQKMEGPVQALCWPCAGPVLALCWSCAGPVLVLCWPCAGPVLALCWPCAGPVLVLCWPCAGPVLALCWSCAGPVLVLCWSCAGPVLVLCWSCAGPVLALCWPCAGPVLALCWPCAGPVLVLCWSCAGPDSKHIDQY
ncbi:hypothetical protein NFI96_006925 [Prochilodus magdalenae]|nr:hypothetical protein NFI96_006925 [Prochilodus magdalenae]